MTATRGHGWTAAVSGRRLAGLAAGAVLACGLGIGDAAAQGTLKVAIVGFYTGAAAGPFGIPSRNAAELVIEAINQGKLPPPYDSTGVGQLQIEPVYIDESGGTAKQVTEYRNAVQRQGVDAFVGYISSGSCLGIAPVAEELKTFTIFFDCGTPRIFEDASYEYVFRTASTATMDSVGAARYVAAKFGGTKTYEGINQNYAWGQDSWRDYELAMKALMPQAKSEGSLFPKLFAGQYGAEISSLSVKRPDVLHTSLWGGDLETFILQSSARALNRQVKMILTTGETTMFRLGKKLPDGIIIGARGPYGVFARKSALNDWLRNSYESRFSTPPTYPSYQMAQALLGLKIAYDKAGVGKVGAKPTSEEAAAALEGAEYEAFGTTVRMALGNGHQAITETAYGLSKYDDGVPTITDIVYFPAECVNPPAGVKSVEWIEGGMQGAKCE